MIRVDKKDFGGKVGSRMTRGYGFGGLGKRRI